MCEKGVDIVKGPTPFYLGRGGSVTHNTLYNR